MLLVHNNSIWRPHFIKFSHWTHHKLWSSNSIIITASTNNQSIWTIRSLSPEHCAELRNLHHHSKPAATSKIIHQNVYATLMNPTCVYTPLPITKPTYTSKLLNHTNFWIKSIPTINILNIYCQFTEIQTVSSKDNPSHLINQSDTNSLCIQFYFQI